LTDENQVRFNQFWSVISTRVLWLVTAVVPCHVAVHFLGSVSPTPVKSSVY